MGIMFHRSRAFTLMELALVLVIVSLMTGFGMQAVENNAVVNCYEATQAQLRTIDDAMQRFAAQQRRLPKPAYMDLGSNDANFGQEALTGVPDSVSKNTPAFGAGVPTGMSETGGTLIGALPHATLGLSAQYAADCWGDKFTYAVVNSQTSSDFTTGYTSGGVGDIALYSGTPSGAPFTESPVLLSNTVTYIVLSHGQDKYGATPLTANNATALNCDGSTAAKVDRENCNIDKVFYNAMNNVGDTSNYFDDLLVFNSKVQSLIDCPAQSIAWGPGNVCTANIAVVAHGTSRVENSAATNWTGSATVSCTDGSLSVTSIDCYSSIPCPAGAIASWGGGCAGITGVTIAHGQTPAVTVNNTVTNRMGSANVSCDNGTLTYPGPNICNDAPACAAGAIAWGAACTASMPSMTAGQVTPGVANTTSWYTGTTDVTCQNTTNGVGASSFQLTNSSCTAAPPSPCASQSVSWGSCTGIAPALAHNGSDNISDNNANKTGAATVTCYNGTSTASGSCYDDCAASTQNWGGGCSSNFPAIGGNGGSTTQASTAIGYTGNVTITCNNGSTAQSGATCTAPCIADGQAQGGGTCCNTDSDGNGVCGFQEDCNFGCYESCAPCNNAPGPFQFICEKSIISTSPCLANCQYGTLPHGGNPGTVCE